MAPTHVVDTSVLLRMFRDPSYANKVVDIVAGAVIPSSVSTELYYKLREKYPADFVEQAMLRLSSLGLFIEPVIAADALRAGELIYESRRDADINGGSSLSLGDGQCIAVAERLRALLFTEDKHWLSLKLATTCISPSAWDVSKPKVRFTQSPTAPEISASLDLDSYPLVPRENEPPSENFGRE